MISKKEFDSIREVTLDDLTEKTFKVGDKFLLGESMLNQKETKIDGMGVSYFEVSECDHKTKKLLYKIKYNVIKGK